MRWCRPSLASSRSPPPPRSPPASSSSGSSRCRAIRPARSRRRAKPRAGRAPADARARRACRPARRWRCAAPPELLADGKRAEAGRSFARFRSLEARVGQAFATWPDGTVDRLNRLAGLHPQRAVVQLNLGVALFWAGLAGAEDAWRAACGLGAGLALRRRGREPAAPRVRPWAAGLRDDRAAAGRARRARARGPARPAPAAGDDGRRQAAVRRRPPAPRSRQRSAERVFAAAARQAPASVEAQVAAAVGRFDKSRPAEAFSRLGPLTRRFPESATVRFHLGLLLLWSGEVARGEDAAHASDARRARLAARRAGAPLPRRARSRPASLSARDLCGSPRTCGYGVGAREKGGGSERASATSAGSEHRTGHRPPDRGGAGPPRSRPRTRKARRRRARARARRARPRRDAARRVLRRARRGADRGRRPLGGRGGGGARARLGVGRGGDLDRHAAALPQGHRQGAAADGRAGGRAREADRARRPRREAGDGRGQPAARRLDREALPQPGPAVPRPDPGGDDRARAGGREVRLAQGIQVLDVRDLVDPPGGRPRDRRQGPHDPDARPRGREAQQDRSLGAEAPRRARPRADRRGDRERPRPRDRGGRADQAERADARLAREAGRRRGGVGVRPLPDRTSRSRCPTRRPR